MPARRTYRRRRYGRRRRNYFRRKKPVYSTNNYAKMRIIKLIRLRVHNDQQGLGAGYNWYDFAQNAQINANTPSYLNVWTDALEQDADFTSMAAKYAQFKLLGISMLFVPSNTQVNAIQNRIDANCYVRCQPVRMAAGASNRIILLDPLSSTKMYWKVSQWCPWCPSNPTNGQMNVANGQLVNLQCAGNSTVNTQANCPQWSVRLCFYCLFKGKQSD